MEDLEHELALQVLLDVVDEEAHDGLWHEVLHGLAHQVEIAADEVLCWRRLPGIVVNGYQGRYRERDIPMSLQSRMSFSFMLS